MRVVLQTRNTFQWHCVPVTESVWPPGTMWKTFFSKLTFAIACASAELMLPSRKSTLSRSISLLAFCTATAASPLVEVLDQQIDLAAENAALGVDLLDRELAPISSFLPTAANVPVSGLSRPILTLSADQAGTTNGEAICTAPAAAAVFSTVRRSSFVERISRFIAFLPRDFFKQAANSLGGTHANAPPERRRHVRISSPNGHTSVCY